MNLAAGGGLVATGVSWPSSCQLGAANTRCYWGNTHPIQVPRSSSVTAIEGKPLSVMGFGRAEADSQAAADEKILGLAGVDSRARLLVCGEMGPG